MVGPNDDLAADDLKGSDWYTKATRLSELGDSSDASVADMWDAGCDEITVYALGRKNGETVICAFHTIRKDVPGVVSGVCGSDNLVALDEMDEELRTQPRPGYLATLEDLRPPVKHMRQSVVE